MQLQNIRKLAYTIAGDTDRANPGLSNAYWDSLINEAYVQIYGSQGPRVAVVGQLFTIQSNVAEVISSRDDVDRILALIFAGLSTNPMYYPGPTLPAPQLLDPSRFAVVRPAGASQGAPLYYTAFRQATGTWKARFEPSGVPSFNRYMSGYVELAAAPLVNDTDEPKVRPHEARLIARMAAVAGMNVLGRDAWKIAVVASLVPYYLRASAQTTAGSEHKETRPGQGDF